LAKIRNIELWKLFIIKSFYSLPERNIFFYRENKYFYKRKKERSFKSNRKIKELLKDWTKIPLN